MIDISGEKSYGWVVSCRIIVSAPVPVPFLRTLNLEFGTGLGLDNFLLSSIFRLNTPNFPRIFWQIFMMLVQEAPRDERGGVHGGRVSSGEIVLDSTGAR